VGGAAVVAGVMGVFAATLPAPPPAEPQPLGAFRAALGDPGVIASMWFVVLPGILFGMLGVLGPLRLSALGLGALGIGATWLVATGCEAVVSPLVGRISDRRGRIAPLRFGLVASAGGGPPLPRPRRRRALS